MGLGLVDHFCQMKQPTTKTALDMTTDWRILNSRLPLTDGGNQSQTWSHGPRKYSSDINHPEMMNQFKEGQRTIVFVHGYKGDQGQIEGNMPAIEHHQLPIVILSPWDSPIKEMGPHICREGGKRAYIGQESLDRQWEHMKIMLDYDWDFALCNDSDSFLLNPEIPQILYNHPNEVFSNEVIDPRPDSGMHAPLPHIAMQPPYFFSRDCLKRMVAIGNTDVVKAHHVTPFIDWYYVQLVYAAGVKHSSFPKGMSCETRSEHGKSVMADRVRKGAEFIHSVKEAAFREHLQHIYKTK